MTETWLKSLAARNQYIPNLSVLKHALEIQWIKKIPLLVITGYSLWMLYFLFVQNDSWQILGHLWHGDLKWL